MRHAKSDWGNHLLTDFDRPLNKRGLNDAPMMGKELVNRNKNIDLIICSSANRAQTTAKLVAKAINYKHDIQLEKSFYASIVSNIILELEVIDNSHNTVLIVAHNPTMENLVYNLISRKTEVVMPTAAIASLQFDIENWADLEFNTGKLEWFIKPKDFKQ